MIRAFSLIEKYYAYNRPLRHILLTHSRQVIRRALQVADRHPELELDRAFLAEASMLHDIGIMHTDAPGICCYGTEPYILHGLLGAEMLRAEGLPRHARVCERHTGTGLTLDTIERQQLPLPPRDFSPQTLEEQVICYADKFYSKSKLEQEKTPDQVRKSLAKFGADNVARFDAWHALFG